MSLPPLLILSAIALEVGEVERREIARPEIWPLKIAVALFLCGGLSEVHSAVASRKIQHRHYGEHRVWTSWAAKSAAMDWQERMLGLPVVMNKIPRIVNLLRRQLCHRLVYQPGVQAYSSGGAGWPPCISLEKASNRK